MDDCHNKILYLTCDMYKHRDQKEPQFTVLCKSLESPLISLYFAPKKPDFLFFVCVFKKKKKKWP